MRTLKVIVFFILVCGTCVSCQKNKFPAAGTAEPKNQPKYTVQPNPNGGLEAVQSDSK
jgi:hypothetical protein